MSEPLSPYINGGFRSSTGADPIELIDPVDESVIGLCDAGSRQDVDDAVAAARAQLSGAWSRLTAEQRALLIFRLADLVERDADLIADLDARAVGRLLAEPRAMEVPMAIGTLRTCAGWADKLEGRTIPTNGYMGRRTLSYTRREPIGVVAAITPWNAPFAILVAKVAPALAAGCTVVVKPSEETPASALHLARLTQEVGFPAGVFNVVPGRGEVVGHALCEHPGVDKVCFTGSPEVGAAIQRTAGPLFKRVALELGGKSPQIVFADADMAAAVQGCAAGLFVNQGQVCAAGSRILVQREIARDFGEALAQAARSVKVGNPREPGVQMGAVAKREQFERINRYIEAGIRDGATLAAGGVAEHRKGWFVRPTIFTDARNDMQIAREEIFGPVGTVIPFDDEAQAVALANDTRYGLAATVWTSDVARAIGVAHAVHAGAVGINCWAPMDPRLPWGGLKTSGIGREGGLAGVLECTEEKVVTVLLPA